MIIRCPESYDWSFTVFTTPDYIHDTGSSFTVRCTRPADHSLPAGRCPCSLHRMVFHRVRYTGPFDRPLPAGNSLCSLHRWFTAPGRLFIHCVHHTGWSFSVHCTEPAGRSLYSLHRTVFIAPDGRSLCALQWTCWSSITRWSFIVLTTPDPLVVHCVRCWLFITRGVFVHCIHYGPLNRTRWSFIICWSFTVLTTSDPLVVDIHCVLFTGSAGGR
jgi:hypothetical protein